MTKYLKVYADNPSHRHVKNIIEALKDGSVIIYPTDTVYGIGCDMYNNEAVERVCRIIGKKPENAHLSLICSNLSNISEFTIPFEKKVYRIMRKAFPGPYTFILNANNNVPKIFKANKKTIGIRVPDNSLNEIIVEELGNPIVTSSIKHDDQILEYPTDAEIILEMFKDQVDMVIDGGPGGNIPSTVIDCTNEEFHVVRQGKGSLDILK
jgi:tRNA threonylcarbamoyl adenosine modification protein (Sua5/YciO/YrdC/YwlC family)